MYVTGGSLDRDCGWHDTSLEPSINCRWRGRCSSRVKTWHGCVLKGTKLQLVSNTTPHCSTPATWFDVDYAVSLSVRKHGCSACIIFLTFCQWALVELARNPEKQRKLREALRREFSTSDPTWDQLTSGLPYLDAVVHETLRFHPPVEELVRVVWLIFSIKYQWCLLTKYVPGSRGRRHPIERPDRNNIGTNIGFSLHS